MIISKSVRLALLAFGVIDMLLFANANPGTILTVAVGTLIMVMGMWYYYRQAAVAGMLLVSIGGASTIQIPTLLELSGLMTALLGLLVPVSVLAWLALSSEEVETANVLPGNRQMMLSALFGILCLWSVPLVTFMISLFVPGLSMRMTTVSEIAIVLLAAALVGTILTYRIGTEPRPRPETSESGKGQ